MVHHPKLHLPLSLLTIATIEPSTDTVLGEVSNCELADFKKAIDSAEKAQEEFYESTTATQRGAFLRKWFNLIMANQDDCKAISKDMSHDSAICLFS
jgi:acyl-CoA reductase-like NAD-dependent aldehyde dehydrogenase